LEIWPNSASAEFEKVKFGATLFLCCTSSCKSGTGSASIVIVVVVAVISGSSHNTAINVLNFDTGLELSSVCCNNETVCVTVWLCVKAVRWCQRTHGSNAAAQHVVD